MLSSLRKAFALITVRHWDHWFVVWLYWLHVVFWAASHCYARMFCRDQLVVQAVSKRMGAKAGEVVRTMLRLSETRSHPKDAYSAPVSRSEIYQSLQQEIKISQQVRQPMWALFVLLSFCWVILRTTSFLHSDGLGPENFKTSLLTLICILLVNATLISSCCHNTCCAIIEHENHRKWVCLNWWSLAPPIVKKK